MSGALRTAEEVGLPVDQVLERATPTEAELAAAAAAPPHPGTLPPYIAEWFAGSRPCIVRSATGGHVHWHVNAAAEQAWSLRKDANLRHMARSMPHALYPDGDWLPFSEVFGKFLRTAEVQACLAQLLLQLFLEVMQAPVVDASGWSCARHLSADVPVPLPLERRGRTLGLYSVRSRLVVKLGGESWAASAFLPPCLDPMGSVPLWLPPSLAAMSPVAQPVGTRARAHAPTMVTPLAHAPEAPAAASPAPTTPSTEPTTPATSAAGSELVQLLSESGELEEDEQLFDLVLSSMAREIVDAGLDGAAFDCGAPSTPAVVAGYAQSTAVRCVR
jgi:hypothetical protein